MKSAHYTRNFSFLNTQDVANLLNIKTRKGARLWLERHAVPRRRVGRAIYVRQEDIEQIIENSDLVKAAP